jgi:hypothetical protein
MPWLIDLYCDPSSHASYWITLWLIQCSIFTVVWNLSPSVYTGWRHTVFVRRHVEPTVNTVLFQLRIMLFNDSGIEKLLLRENKQFCFHSIYWQEQNKRKQKKKENSVYIWLAWNGNWVNLLVSAGNSWLSGLYLGQTETELQGCVSMDVKLRGGGKLDRKGGREGRHLQVKWVEI